jgi:hypothetical protein
MVMTDTVHPPGGATALVAATIPEIRNLGWWLLPIVLLSVVLVTAVGCIFGNFPLDMEWSDRRWPLYWWKGENGDYDCERREFSEGGEDGEESGMGERSEGVDGTIKESGGISSHMESSAASHCTLRGIEKGHIMIVPGKVFVAEGLDLSQEEISLLEGLSRRIGF